MMGGSTEGRMNEWVDEQVGGGVRGWVDGWVVDKRMDKNTRKYEAFLISDQMDQPRVSSR